MRSLQQSIMKLANKTDLTMKVIYTRPKGIIAIKDRSKVVYSIRCGTCDTEDKSQEGRKAEYHHIKVTPEYIRKDVPLLTI